MPDAKIDRRNFIQGATMAGAAAQIPAQKKMIGIQVGAISFLDEGVEHVLDIFQQRAIHRLERDPPAILYHAVGNGDVTETAVAFSAELDSPIAGNL